MATVRCPSCRRALHLPENREVEEAQCPLCQTTFPVHSSPVPLIRTIPAFVETIPPVPRPEAPPPRADAPSPRDVPESPESKMHRRAVEVATTWLNAMSLLGIVQIVLCGCCEGLEAGLKPGIENFQFVLFLILLRTIALLVIWSASDSFRKFRSMEYVRVGALLGIVLGLYMLFRSRIGWIHLLELFGPPGRGSRQEAFQMIYGLLFAVVGLPGLVGGIQTLLLLKRPGVRSLFNR